MKTLVVGMGVVGTTWGWALANAGVEITHLIRPGNYEKCRNGVTLVLRDGRKGQKKQDAVKYDPKCVEAITPQDLYDLIIISVNFDKVEAVLDELVPLAGDAVFLLFGANWSGLEAIEQRLPEERYLIGFPRGGGTQRDGVYSVSLESGIILGEARGGRTEKLQKVEALFAQAGIQSEIPDHILHVLWASHAMAVGFGAGLAQNRDVDSFLRDRKALIRAYSVTREIFGLCRQRGADPYQSFPQSAIYKLPAWLFVVVVRLLSAADPGLKLILARLSQTNEEEALRGAMLTTAQELKFSMPLLTAVEADFKH